METEIYTTKILKIQQIHMSNDKKRILLLFVLSVIVFHFYILVLDMRTLKLFSEILLECHWVENLAKTIF